MPRQPTFLQKNDGAIRLGFNGQLLEPWGCHALGHGHRVYSPSLLIFHSPDSFSPFGRGGINAYAYCAGDPINATDPSGRWLAQVVPGLGALVAAALLFRLHVSVYRNPETTKVALRSAQFSMVGSLIGIYGAIERIAGGGETSLWVSFAGTLFSSVGAVLRYPITKAAEDRGFANLAKRQAEEAARRAAAQNRGFTRSLSAPPPGGSRHSRAATPPTPEPVAPPEVPRARPVNSPSSAPSSFSAGAPRTLGNGRVRLKDRARPSLFTMFSAEDIRGVTRVRHGIQDTPL